MARTKNTKRGRKAALKAVGLTSPATAAPASDLDVATLLDEADRLIGSCEPTKAANLCRTVLHSDGTNPRALETLALIELEAGEIGAAHKLLERCARHAKPVPPTVHLYLAQLANSPGAALTHFQAALALLRAKLDALVPSPVPVSPSGAVRWSAEEAEVRRSASHALVGMTEIYLTDLCFEPGAEEKCLDYLAQASSLDPTDPEPLQTLASVRLSQEEGAAAKEALLLAWALWRDKSPFPAEKDVEMAPDEVSASAAVQTAEPVEAGDQTGGAEVLVEEDEGLPAFETRVQWAKLAIECDMWAEAIEVLQQCEAEDDSEGAVQYLLGVAWQLMGAARDPDTWAPEAIPSDARVTVGEGLGRAECWMEARECLDTCLQLHERLGDAAGLDKSILSHIKELNQELEKVGIVGQPTGEEQDEAKEAEEDEEDEGEWEDASDVEMES